MLVPSNLWLFNKATKILCRYDSNKKSTFQHQPGRTFYPCCPLLVPYSLSCHQHKTERGAVVIPGIFWIMQMDFREVIYTTSGLQGRSRSLKLHHKANLLWQKKQITLRLPLVLFTGALDCATARQQLEGNSCESLFYYRC